MAKTTKKKVAKKGTKKAVKKAVKKVVKKAAKKKAVVKKNVEATELENAQRAAELVQELFEAYERDLFIGIADALELESSLSDEELDEVMDIVREEMFGVSPNEDEIDWDLSGEEDRDDLICDSDDETDLEDLEEEHSYYCDGDCDTCGICEENIPTEEAPVEEKKMYGSSDLDKIPTFEQKDGFLFRDLTK